MAGIRELRERLASVRSAGKITTAMQMVASAKLKKASCAVENFLPYQQQLQSILDDFLGSEHEFDIYLKQKRALKRVTLVAFSSNTGFCGSFNNSIINELQAQMKKYADQELRLITVGKKVSQAVKSMNYTGETESWDHLVATPDYANARDFADHLIDLYRKKKTDKVVLIYFHYKNPLVHELRTTTFLPLDFERMKKKPTSFLQLYILEPNALELLLALLPKVLRSQIYAAILDSFSSEQGARTVAMQAASENAGRLSEELLLQINRQRQQMITTEILELSSSIYQDNDF